MDLISLKPERQAQLEAFAREHGQSPADALDDALAVYLEQERRDFADSVASIERGYADVRAGRTRPAQDLLNELRRQYGFER